MQPQNNRKFPQYKQQIEDIEFKEMGKVPSIIKDNPKQLQPATQPKLERILAAVPVVDKKALTDALFLFVVISLRLAFWLVVGFILGLIWLFSSLIDIAKNLTQKEQRDYGQYDSPNSSSKSVEVNVNVKINE